MNLRATAFPAVIVGVMSVLCTPPARATLTLKTQPSSVYQYMTSAAVYLGHTVIAGTNLNRLVAGGSFTATCASPATTSITGERTLSSNLIGQYNQLYVTIPESLPALRNMPGFENVQRGARIMCTYDWKSFAREPTYTVGVPGFTITVGGEEFADSGTVTFWMQKPGTSTGGDDACIP